MNIHITFDPNWIYADGGIHSFAVARVIRGFRQQYGDNVAEIENSAIDGCSVRLNMDASPEAVATNVIRIISEGARTEDASVYHVEIDGRTVGGMARPAAGGGELPAQAQEAHMDGRPKQPREAAVQSAAGREAAEPGAAQQAEDGQPKPRRTTRTETLPPEESTEQVPADAAPDEDAADAPRDPEAEPAADVPAGAEAPAAEETRTALDEVDRLVGFGAFKDLCHEIADRAEAVFANRTENVFFARNYLFVINQGEGLSNVLQLFTDVLTEAGYFDRGRDHDVREVEVPSPEGEHAEDRFLNFLGSLDTVYAKERVVCYDITAWLGHTQKEPFKKLLLRIFREKQHCVNILRMPVSPERLTKQTLEDLADVLTVEQITFAPRTSEELRELAGEMLAKYDITVAQNAWEIFDRRVATEKQDGYFYGLHTLRKITDQMVLRMESYNAANGIAVKTITPEKLVSFDQTGDEEKHGEEKLASMVGMEQVKQQLRSIVNQIMVAQTGAVKTRPGMHMCFVGAPGTGKTTVARLVGEILADRKLLRNGRFYEYRGRDLCGRYVGETAIKTREICREAYGSVLFIDEAYSLFRGDHSTVDFGREAIDTLIAEMENHAEELVVILAGYADDMETMLTANSGMNSRIPYKIEFPNYTRDELYEIFRKFIPDSMDYDDAFLNCAKKFFDDLPQSVMDSRDFGNGRFARNLYERTWGKAVSERILKEGERIRLTPEDLSAAGEELLGRNSDRRQTIGF